MASGDEVTIHDKLPTDVIAVHEYQATARCSCGFVRRASGDTLGEALSHAEDYLKEHLRAETAQQ